MSADRARTWANIHIDPPPTYRNIVATHLELLRRAIGPTDDAAVRQIELVCSLLGAWADEPVEQLDHYRSFVGNDGSPVEFSVAMTRSGAAARLLFEQLGGPPPWRQEGAGFVERLHETLGLDVGRFRRIADLFDGTPPPGSFSMMYGAALTTDDLPLFKVYLNPAIGPMRPLRTVGAAMERLGLSAQWSHLNEYLEGGTFDWTHHEIGFFAMDLGAFPDARVKLYIRHTGCGPDEIERIAMLAPDHQPDLFTKILGRLYNGPIAVKAPVSCLSFVEGRVAPATITLHCPLDTNAADDAEAGARVTDVLEMSGIAPDLFGTLTSAISGADPAGGRRLSWMSYKRPADPVVTVYAGLDGSAR
ncbi:tryptophan dimethylallyltransferase family protein [Nocardia alni]|uniref:tryptophan dimethylallyltransferase family protein n=1 Tax=Nocardia alni TaxID=2815723 RepID=UPI001C210D56|nr:tryptophan dimethylallyltransferase family protein [Nocardia alni]